jgi:hypothetical protein
LPTDNNIANVIAQAEVALLELRELCNNGPQLRIVHRYRRTGTACQPGEEVAAVLLVHRNQEIPVPLSLSLRIVLNFLAEWRRIPQSATQIAVGIHASAFYRKHGLNAGAPLRRNITRSAVREYIQRIRKALGVAFASASLSIESKNVLVSEITMGNEILYRLRAAIEWIHLD